MQFFVYNSRRVDLTTKLVIFKIEDLKVFSKIGFQNYFAKLIIYIKSILIINISQNLRC